MRNITKLFLIIIVLNVHQETNAELFGIGDNFNLCSFYGPIRSLEETIRLNYKLQKALDAPDIIKQFCYEKIKSRGLKANHVQIKIVADQSLAAFGESYLVFGYIAASELKKALENPTDEKSIHTVNMYSVLLDHEIAHLKNNDGPVKRLAAYTGATLIGLGVSAYIMNSSRFNYLFHANGESTKIGSHSTNSRILLDLGTQILSFFIYSRYAQFQERRADAYAVSLANEPDGLCYAADFLELSDNNLINFLSDAKFNIESPFKSFVMITLRRAYFTFYQIKKPDENFHSWVKKQPLAYSFVKFLYDIEHPSGSSRAKAMRVAADALKA